MPTDPHTTAALTVGQQVMFAEDEQHTTSLGVISRVWPNGKYVSVICDGHLYVRLIEQVRVTGITSEPARSVRRD